MNGILTQFSKRGVEEEGGRMLTVMVSELQRHMTNVLNMKI
jgi:hypothetical protein